MRPIYLKGISYVLGQQKPIEELTVLARDPRRLESYRAMGFRHFRHAEEPASVLATQAIERLLQEHQIQPEKVGVVLYCSNTLGEEDYYRVLQRSFARMGLNRAFPIGVHFTFCGNFGSGLRLAVALIGSGDVDSAIVVCTDKNETCDDPKRLVEPGVGITSDGAAACLLTTEGGSLRVIGVSQLVDHTMSQIDISDIHTREKTRSVEFFEYSLSSLRGRKEASLAFMKRFHVDPAAVVGFVANNYGENTLKGFAADSGVSWERVFRANVDSNGHVHSADNLINLKTFLDRRPASTGDKILMLSTGPYSWGFAAVEAT
jgi:3-oxoacyl-[acyl-carrier-protein] synthase III